MTTPDKEEMPTDRTEGQFRKKPVVVDAVQLRQRFLWPDWFHDAVSSNVIITHGLGKYGTGPVYCEIKTLEGVMRANAGDWVVRGTQGEIYPCKPDIFIEIYEPVGIATAFNAYEPMREALILAEKADRIHSKCQECEDGAQAPEACGDCFPSADDARVARRNVLKSLGVRMRDVDRARAIEAEPSICNCSQEDVHDYGPCGEDCRSLVVSTLPVNDRHHSGSDSYQADAGAPALSEKVNVRSEWRPIESAPADGTEILAYMPGLALGQIVLYWQDGYWRKKANSMGLKYPPTHWMPLPSPPGAELNFSNDAERDGVSLKPDTSSQPASEAGKLSTDTGEVA